MVLAGCDGGAIDSNREPLPTLSYTEVERRIVAARELAQYGEEERALSSLELAADEDLDPASRRAFAKTALEIRRSRFWRDSPLRTSLRLHAERPRYGDSIRVELTFTNLGGEAIEFDAFHRSFVDSLRFGEGERAVLDVSLERRECDAVGTRMVERENVSIDLEDDLTIEPGASSTIVLDVPIEPRRGALFGAIRVSAVLRPVSISAGDDRRYDPLWIGSGCVTVVRKEVEPWFDVGLARLDDELAVAAETRPEALLLAIAGLRDADLRPGLERVVRALPSLEPRRRRLAQGALAWCLGRDLATDPVNVIGWWDAEGSAFAPAELMMLRYGGRATPGRWFAGGLSAEDPSARSISKDAAAVR